MNGLIFAIVTAVLLLNSLTCHATVVTCGDAGTFMYSYDMTYEGSDGENTFPPCSWCDYAAGKWSDAFTPTAQGTGCGCISGRYYAAGVDGSFACPMCPSGTYKNGVSRVETCTPIASGAEAQLVSPVSETSTSHSAPVSEPSTSNGAPVSQPTSSGAPVSEPSTSNGAPGSDLSNPSTTSSCDCDIPTWIITVSLTCGIVFAVVCTIALIVYIKKHEYNYRISNDLEAPLYDSKSSFHDTNDVMMNTGPNDGENMRVDVNTNV
jgi:hypothetical protein